MPGSYVSNTPAPSVKSGVVLAGSFSGSPKKYTVTFATPYDTGVVYVVGFVGKDQRAWTYENPTTTGFVINTGANTALTGSVTWYTIEVGEF